MEKKMIIPKTGFTHAGCFHADDVFSTALLCLVNPDFVWLRGNTVPEDFEGIVYDIGGGKYDHHGCDEKKRSNGVPYAAFGLLWKEFGKLFLEEDGIRRLDEDFVQSIDKHDNGVEFSEIGLIIKEMNPFDCDQAEYDAAFTKAVTFAKEILANKIVSVKRSIEVSKELDMIMSKAEDGMVILDSYTPAIRLLDPQKIGVVIYPSNREGYNIQLISDRGNRNNILAEFPAEWCGASPEKLKKCSGIDDMIFCHVGGFLGATKSFESAKKVAQMVRKCSENSLCKKYR